MPVLHRVWRPPRSRPIATAYSVGMGNRPSNTPSRLESGENHPTMISAAVANPIFHQGR